MEAGELSQRSHSFGAGLAKSVLYPRATLEGILSPLAFFDVGKLDPKGKPRSAYVSSVADRGALGSDDAVHAYGCRLAHRATEKAKARHEDKANFDKFVHNGTFYLGFYNIEFEDVLSSPSEFYRLSVKKHEEGGETCHCHILFECRADLPQDIDDFRGKAAADRTGIINYLFAKKDSASRHICPEDWSRSAELIAVQDKLFL